MEKCEVSGRTFNKYLIVSQATQIFSGRTYVWSDGPTDIGQT